MQYRALGNTGLNVSALSFGASSLGSVFKNIDEKEGIRTVHEALDLGINLIDVSPYYGLTKAESVLGKALKTVQRDRFILSTKAGRYGENEFDFSADRIFRSVEESLDRLNTDYIDILHLHDIEFGNLDQIIKESIPALQKLKEQGKIRFTGITGFPLHIFPAVLEQIHVDAIISYCHYSLNNNRLLELLPLLQEKGVGLINASPISMGLLSKQGPPDWHPATEEIKSACLAAAKLCQERGKDLSKLAIQYSVANPTIPTTLVGTANPDNIMKNAAWINEPIDLDLFQDVQHILRPILNRSW
ncbi:aldo/keto reductase [Paenibacillus harenae]|uniref:Aryl-alcohol dehydrogenase-like predicted oxidoreductase n=1 Tax=Paenibacillus harenae TaxID=306543 RepID=A0ABT9U804_PAEHA|nr:aldo/keto reductase [Paenibacillus harenae]MDQ0115698.1 aryl-alcohol dehydrogenase-like predicted oxidoreductase [Paenibacillus harenae]